MKTYSVNAWIALLALLLVPLAIVAGFIGGLVTGDWTEALGWASTGALLTLVLTALSKIDLVYEDETED